MAKCIRCKKEWGVTIEGVTICADCNSRKKECEIVECPNDANLEKRILDKVVCDECWAGSVVTPEGEFINGVLITNTKETVLEEAIRITSTDRNKHYGHPFDNFKVISEFWTTYLGFEISKRDVSMMMVLLKVARDKNMPKRDNLVDGCGYFRTAEMVEEREEENGKI